jgi:uncharacterized protein YbaP (TraB family)
VSGRAAPVFAAALLLAVATYALPAHAGRYEHGLLFEVRRDGAPPSYVFGTLHSNDARVVDLPQPVQDALAHARRVALESVLSDAELPAFLEAAQYADQRRLADHFDQATLARIRAALGDRAPSPDTFERLKPWAVLILLSQPNGDDHAPALDQKLELEARKRGLRVLGLELPEEQAAALDGIPVASQVALVQFALDQREAWLADQERAISAWLARDLGKLAALAREPGRRDPALAPHLAALTRHLIDDRSVLMAHRLFLPLREGRIFVAVGALHLYGERGLLAAIAGQGYRVRRIY